MIFQEKKTEKGFSYYTEDVFGKLYIQATIQIKPELLDDLVVFMLKRMKHNMAAKEITGKVELPTKAKDVIEYKFEPAELWSEDDDDEELNEQTLCESIRTSIKKPADVFIVTGRLMMKTLNWCRKFAAAFRVAWKKANQKN